MEQKKEKCAKESVTLVVIPYWWDCQKESLAATLKSIRPDLVPNATGSFMTPLFLKLKLLGIPILPSPTTQV